MSDRLQLMLRIAADSRQARDTLDRISGQLRTLGASTESAAAAADKLSGKITTIGRIGGGLFALNVAANALGVSFGRVTQAIDSWNVIIAKMRIASGNAQNFGAIQARVFEMAQNAGVRFAEVGDIYAKMARGAESLGLSQVRVLGITQAIVNTMRLMGGSSAGASAALMQFGQALSAGVLRGEELNSVLEQMPSLAEAIAKGMGREAGELRKLAREGRLTVDEIIQALEKAAPELARIAADMPITFSAGMHMLDDAVDRYLYTLDKAMGASDAFGSAIRALTGNIDKVAIVFAGVLSLALGKTIAILKDVAAKHMDAARFARLHALDEANLAAQTAQAAMIKATADKQAAATALARANATLAELNAERAMLAQMAIYGPARARVEAQIAQATLARKAAADAAAAAEVRLAAASTAATVAAGNLAKAGRAATALRGVMAFLGGPIGMITTLLTFGASAWLLWGNNASDAADIADKKIKSVADRLKVANAELATMHADRDAIDAEAARIAALRARQAGLGAHLNERGFAVLPKNASAEDRKRLTEWYKLQGEIASSSKTLDELQRKLAEKGIRGSTRAFIEAGMTEAEQAAAKIKTIREQFEREVARLDKRDPKYAEILRKLEKSRDEQIRQVGKSSDGRHEKKQDLVAPLLSKTNTARLKEYADTLDLLVARQKAGKMSVDLYAEAVDVLVNETFGREFAAAEAEMRNAFQAQAVEFEEREAMRNYQIEQDEKAAAALGRMRDAMIDIIDPIQRYREELDKVDELVDAGMFTPEQAAAARMYWHEQIDAAAGFGQALQDEVDKTADLARDLGMTFSSAFEDAILSGKKFSDVLNSIAQDITRIVIRKTVTEPIAREVSSALKESGIGKMFSGLFGGLFGGAKAAGGPVAAGRAYLVGERGPELYLPGVSGYILPNHALQAAGGSRAVVVNMHVEATDAGSFRRSMGQIKADLAFAVGSAQRNL